MKAASAIITAALILVIGGAATAWLAYPRYTLSNPGAGITVRLNTRSGELLGCDRLSCRVIADKSGAVSNPFDRFDRKAQ